MPSTLFAPSFVHSFKLGALIAYPTEAVFGLGCDPSFENAVMDLLVLKNRPMDKGLILIASDMSQLTPFIDFEQVPEAMQQQILASWPGPNTWLLPKQTNTPDYLTGGSSLIAVRISQHPTVVAMCNALNSAVVSTSANLNGHEPARDAEGVKAQFADKVICVEGDVGGNPNPSCIRHGLTGDIIRAS